MRRDRQPVNKQLAVRVVWAISQEAPIRFNALERVIKVHPSILSRVLKRCVRDGLVVREVRKVDPPADVRYSLSPLGAGLAQCSAAFVDWLDRHDDDIHFARDRARGDAEVARMQDLMVASEQQP
jgi:DNA-binding HxlR family transcriptional regulator